MHNSFFSNYSSYFFQLRYGIWGYHLSQQNVQLFSSMLLIICITMVLLFPRLSFYFYVFSTPIMPFDKPLFIWQYISLAKVLGLPCIQQFCAHQITAHSRFFSSTDSCCYVHLGTPAHKLHFFFMSFHTKSLLYVNLLKSLPFTQK